MYRENPNNMTIMGWGWTGLGLHWTGTGLELDWTEVGLHWTRTVMGSVIGNAFFFFEELDWD